MYAMNERERLEPVMKSDEMVTRRQEASTTYVINGAVYVAWTDWLRKTESFLEKETIAHPMPEARSADVDTEIDLEWCMLLLGRQE
jgi:CMP-N-acetylneuraminic acid synthetase